MHPCQKMKFLGMEIDLIKMTLSLTPEKIQKSCQNLSEPSQESFYNSSGIDQDYRSFIIHHTSSRTCKDSVKTSLTTKNCTFKEKMNPQSVITLNTKSRTKLNLVDTKLEVLQWPNFFSIELTNHYLNRCFPHRVGAVCNGV